MFGFKSQQRSRQIWVGLAIGGGGGRLSVMETAVTISLRSKPMNHKALLILRSVVGCALVLLSGCRKNEEESAFKQPVTPEQAASVIDLSTFPLMNNAKPGVRAVANFSCEAPGDVKSVFEFHRGQLLSHGW